MQAEARRVASLAVLACLACRPSGPIAEQATIDPSAEPWRSKVLKPDTRTAAWATDTINHLCVDGYTSIEWSARCVELLATRDVLIDSYPTIEMGRGPVMFADLGELAAYWTPKRYSAPMFLGVENWIAAFAAVDRQLCSFEREVAQAAPEVETLPDRLAAAQHAALVKAILAARADLHWLVLEMFTELRLLDWASGVGLVDLAEGCAPLSHICHRGKLGSCGPSILTESVTSRRADQVLISVYPGLGPVLDRE